MRAKILCARALCCMRLLRDFKFDVLNFAITNKIFLIRRSVGAFLTLCPEFCFVVEDGNDVVGYAAAALNAKEFYQKLKAAWIPEMCLKYPNKLNDVDDGIITPSQVRS